MDTAGKELTRQQKKIIIKLSNSNSNQGFILNTLNVRQACVYMEASKMMEMFTKRKKVASNWQTTKSE